LDFKTYGEPKWNDEIMCGTLHDEEESGKSQNGKTARDNAQKFGNHRDGTAIPFLRGVKKRIAVQRSSRLSTITTGL
jgi:hypothetical protein